MHPSSARHYSDLLPPTNISPFFKFSQHFRARLPADWQGAHFPEPFPPFPPGWLPTCGGAEAADPPARVYITTATQKQGLVPRPAHSASPQVKTAVFPMQQPPGRMGWQVWAAGGDTEPHTSITGCPQPLQWVPKVPAPPCCLLMVVQIKVFDPKEVKAVHFLTFPLPYCREMFPQN